MPLVKSAAPAEITLDGGAEPAYAASWKMSIRAVDREGEIVDVLFSAPARQARRVPGNFKKEPIFHEFGG